LEVSTIYDSWIIEVAVLRIIYCVAEHVSQPSLLKDLSIHFRNGGRGNDKRDLVQIGGLENARLPANDAFPGPLLQLPNRLGSDHLNGCASFDEAADFAFCDLAGSDHQATSSIEF
jgi:hypothetical protein